MGKAAVLHWASLEAVTPFNSGLFGLCYSSSPVTAENMNGGGWDASEPQGHWGRIQAGEGQSTWPCRLAGVPGVVCMEPGSPRGGGCAFTHTFSHICTHTHTHPVEDFTPGIVVHALLRW